MNPFEHHNKDSENDEKMLSQSVTTLTFFHDSLDKI